MQTVIGRDPERAAIAALLEDARERLSVLVLEGEAGIGKTTIWREALREAEALGYHVLACRPAQAETKLGLAAVADLFRDVDDAALAPLPEPQRIALEVALLRATARSAPPNARAVGAAVVSLLGSQAAHEPLLVALDDVQWLDPESAEVLSFAFRRLGERRIGVLVAERIGEARKGLLNLADVAPDRSHRTRLGPLNLSALYHVIRNELGLVFPRPTLQRIAQASGGNPFVALELARALENVEERIGPGAPLPVPDTVAELLRARIEKLPAASREALLAVASLSTPTVSVVERALGTRATRALDTGVRAQILTLRDERIRFVHPLLASAVASSASAEQRRAMSRRLAEVVDSEEEAARHLALAADVPDESTALALEQAAQAAWQRGAPVAGAELVELAMRLTPVQSAHMERRELLLARLLSHSGDLDRAAAIATALSTRRDAPIELRLAAFHLRAHLAYWRRRDDDPFEVSEQALTAAAGDLRREGVCHAFLALYAHMQPQRMGEHARRAIAALDPPETGEERRALATALSYLVRHDLFTGRGLRRAELERAIALEAEWPPDAFAERSSYRLAQWLRYVDDFEGSRRGLEDAYRAAQEAGDESSLVDMLMSLTALECWAGDYPAATRYADECVALGAELGMAAIGPAAFRALVGAHVDGAHVRTELVHSGAAVDTVWAVLHLGPLALLALGEDNAGEADGHLRRALSLLDEAGFDEPATFRVHADAVESAIAVGELERAGRVLERWEKHAQRVMIPWNLATSARCRALLVAARGDRLAALEVVEAALQHHVRLPMPFELARTLLVAGEIQRRANRRRAAVDSFERAAAMFAELGAPLWAARAHAELGRVPIKRRSEGALTPSEARVAELVMSGKTNQEVAHALFVSTKTVEANLTRIYRKLGVRSRSALAARMRESEGEEPAKL